MKTKLIIAAGLFLASGLTFSCKPKHETAKQAEPALAPIAVNTVLIYPDRKETHGEPYEGIANLRPETHSLLEYFHAAQKAAK